MVPSSIKEDGGRGGRIRKRVDNFNAYVVEMGTNRQDDLPLRQNRNVVLKGSYSEIGYD